MGQRVDFLPFYLQVPICVGEHSQALVHLLPSLRILICFHSSWVPTSASSAQHSLGHLFTPGASEGSLEASAFLLSAVGTVEVPGS